MGELQFCLQCSESRLDLTNSLFLPGGSRFPSPLSGLPSSFIWQLCHASLCPAEESRPADSTAIAAIGCQGPRWHLLSLQPSDLLSLHPPIPSCNPTQAQSGLKLLIPLMQLCFQAAGYIPVSQTRSSPVNPSFVLPALCFAHSFQFTWPKECACWNSAACTSCSALLSGSHQWQVSFFEISHTTASVPSGLSSAICQSVIFHLDCNAAKHRAFAVTWLLISRCRTMFSLFLL